MGGDWVGLADVRERGKERGRKEATKITSCDLGSYNFKGTARGVYSEERGKHLANGVYWEFSPYIHQ